MNWWPRDYDDEFDDDFDDYDYDDIDCNESHKAAPNADIIEGPIHAVNRRGSFGTQWLGKQWIAAVDALYGIDRQQTGRTYARNGSVQRLEIATGNIYGLVQGSHSYPYCTTIKIKKLTDPQWKKLLTALRVEAVYAAKLLAGEMPPTVEAVLQSLGASLFPSEQKKLSFSCTCPDYIKPCKHAVAICNLLVEQMEADPFILFHILGRTRTEVLEALNVQRGEAPEMAEVGATLPVLEKVESAETLPLTLEDFGARVEAYRPLTTPVEPVRPPLFERYGVPPADLKRGLEIIYRAVSAGAKGWLET